jgi:D-3-phosphoglycerate dehydrogenase
MYRVVTTDLLRPTIPEEAILKEAGASLTYGDAKTEAELIELTQDADAIIDVYAPITAKVINSLKKCRIIVRRGIGYDSVDVAAATAKGIPVANVQDYCIEEVADHTMALLLSVARRVVKGVKQIESGGWNFRALLPVPALKESTLGLVGFGKIPRAVAERAKCFGLEIQTSDPFIPPEMAAEHSVKLVSLEELVKSSDFISVHAPLNEKTRGMISQREFAVMKPSAVLINTARGPVVDEAALIEALKSGRIAAAALDVMTKEPPDPDNPLRKMDNVILTPHLAWYSERSARLAGEKAGQDIVRVFNGYFPKYLVNPDVAKIRTDLKQTDKD